MKKNYTPYLCLILCFSFFTNYAQSDDPTGAPALIVGTDFNTNVVIADNTAATASEISDPSIPTPTCGGYAGGDLWYTVVVPANGNLIIETRQETGSPVTDTTISLYSGVVGSLVEVQCNDDDGIGAFSLINLTGLTPTTTLYIRVWEFANTVQGTFQVSAWSTDPPANDDPATAIALTVGANFDANVVSGTNVLASDSEIVDLTIPNPGCANYSGQDVWYTAIVPANGNLIIETQFETGSTVLDTGIAVYVGAIGTFSLLQCDDFDGNNDFSQVRLSGQTPGETLHIRIWEDSNLHQDAFNISAWSIDEPANDDPIDAIALTLGIAATANPLTGANVFASNSVVDNPTTCGDPIANTADGDLWYSIMVPSNGSLTLETTATTPAGIDDTLIAVYSGDPTGTLTLIQCDNNSGTDNFSLIDLTSQTPGMTLYVRVWENNNDNYGTFQVSAYSTPPPNDDPSGAQSLTIGSNFNSNAIIDDNNLATASEITDVTIPAPSCGGYTGGDIWYTAVVPANGNIIIETQQDPGSPLTDTTISAYSGIIGSFVEIGCDDDGGVGAFSQLTLTGQTPGATLYIRVWEFANTVAGSFKVSAWTEDIPVNDDPVGALALTVGSNFNTNPVVGSNVFATASQVSDPSILNPGCANYLGGDVWYTAVVPSNGKIVIETRENSGSILDDTGIAVYSGTIGALTVVDCDDSDGINFFSQIRLSSLTPGEILYIRVWEDSNPFQGSFTISAWSVNTPINNDALNATALTVGGNFNTNPLTAYNTYASSSSVPDPTTCVGGAFVNDASRDIWFSAVVPDDGSLNIETKSALIESVVDNTVIAIYSGDPSTALTIIDCNDDGGTDNFSLINLTGQTPGETLYIRAWSYNNDQFGEFQISAYGTPPVNDEPVNATSLTIGTDFSSNAMTNTNALATASEVTDPSITIPSCGGYVSGDVWYSAVVPANGTIVFETRQATASLITDTTISVYSGTIGSLTELACDDDGGTGAFSLIKLTGQTPGTLLYLRAWEFANTVSGDFQVSAYSADAPANDEPVNAISLLLGSDFNSNPLTASNVIATASETIDPSLPAPGCAEYNGGDIWYSVVVPPSGSLSLETQAATGSSITDTGLAVYSGAVGSLTLIQCNDDHDTTTFSKIDLIGQTPGATFYVRAWTVFDAAFDDFLIAAYSNADISVPDDNFETELIALGYDSGALDGFVLSANIATVPTLDVSSKAISDLTGIEAFTALTTLNCSTNTLTDLDLSSNNNLVDINLSGNTLVSLNIANGNNANITAFDASGNADLTCITVDNQTIADDWNTPINTPTLFSIDVQQAFSTNCDAFKIKPIAFLQGALLNSGNLIQMRDNLRTASLLPTISPYDDSAAVDPTVFNTGGSSGTGLPEDDIVDWISVQLRDGTNSAILIDSQSALLQRDGDIVALDGTSDITFLQPAKHYFIVVNHRNHLGIMTATKQAFPETLSLSFNDSASATFGTNAQIEASTGVYAMWAGDVNGNGQVRYLGPANDTATIKDNILNPINGNPSGSNFYPYNGYDNADINMNGLIRYLGPNNDTTILKDIIVNHPSNTSGSNFFPFSSQAPNN